MKRIRNSITIFLILAMAAFFACQALFPPVASGGEAVSRTPDHFIPRDELLALDSAIALEFSENQLGPKILTDLSNLQKRLRRMPAPPKTPPPPDGPAIIPQEEFRALDMAITLEISSKQLGTRTLENLRSLRQRLLRLFSPVKALLDDGPTNLAALSGGDGDGNLARLEAEAAKGNRVAARSLAFHHMYLNEPEKARELWRRYGQANDFDLAYIIFSAYLNLALGEHAAGRRDLATALRLIDTRTTLAVSEPVFCTNIAGYRLYDLHPPGDLLPGEDVLIYVELEGVEFRTALDGMSECHVTFGLKLRDDKQITRWAEPNYGDYAPVFSGPIRDFHAALTWRIPNDLEPGNYRLTVEAVEEATKRRGEATTSFNVAKRETNPEKRVTGGPPELGASNLAPGFLERSKAYDDIIREAQKNSPAAPALAPLNPENPADRQKIDLYQQHLQKQRVN